MYFGHIDNVKQINASKIISALIIHLLSGKPGWTWNPFRGSITYSVIPKFVIVANWDTYECFGSASLIISPIFSFDMSSTIFGLLLLLLCRKSTKQYFTTHCNIFSPIRNNINYYEHQVIKIFTIHNRAIVVAIVTVKFPPRGARKIKCNTVEILHSVESQRR